jgi:hypothetical protein
MQQGVGAVGSSVLLRGETHYRNDGHNVVEHLSQSTDLSCVSHHAAVAVAVTAPYLHGSARGVLLMRACRRCRGRGVVGDIAYWLLILVLGLAVHATGGFPT